MNIELHIDELVLHGFAQGDRVPIGEAVRHELTRLLMEQGIPQRLGRGAEAAELDGGAIHINHGAKPEMVGKQVAAAVYGRLGTV
ncbi:MAG: hypothetical protein ACRERE_44260 [Candidatus Entotheonellia bacterium]